MQFRLYDNDIYLFWEEGTQMKSQRALARGAQNNNPEDVNILNYYTYVLYNIYRKTEFMM